MIKLCEYEIKKTVFSFLENTVSIPCLFFVKIDGTRIDYLPSSSDYKLIGSSCNRDIKTIGATRNWILIVVIHAHRKI